MGDIKKKAALKAGINEDKLQLFWHNKELTPEFNTRTLLEMNLHTGFSLMGEARCLHSSDILWINKLHTRNANSIVSLPQDMTSAWSQCIFLQ